jgi:hypothetical protein
VNNKKWRLIITNTPHQTVLAEAALKTMQISSYKTIGRQKASFTELETLTTQMKFAENP